MTHNAKILEQQREVASALAERTDSVTYFLRLLLEMKP